MLPTIKVLEQSDKKNIYFFLMLEEIFCSLLFIIVLLFKELYSDNSIVKCFIGELYVKEVTTTKLLHCN